MNRLFIPALAFLALSISCSNQTSAPQLPLLKVSKSKTHLETEDGSPFFWLGGTAWELFHRLSKEDATLYLENRAKKGFTIIQAVVLAELDGLNTPNVYGHKPLINNNPTQLNEPYFEHVDWVIKKAEALGLYIALLPTWGDKFNLAWGLGPEIFTPDNAFTFGVEIAKRYSDQSNIVWVLGGDRWPEDEEDRAIVNEMAAGIRSIDTKHLMTYHPGAGNLASDQFDEPWLDFDMYQTGHDRNVKDYSFIIRGKAKQRLLPIVNGEPRYENHPNRFNPEEFGWLDAVDLRSAAWWTMLSGGAGFTYGSHDIWQMFDNEVDPINGARTHWKASINLPGSKQMGIMKGFLTKFNWQDFKMHQKAIINDNPEDLTHQIAAINKERNVLIAYTPFGKELKLELSDLNLDVFHATWFNPRDGSFRYVGSFKDLEEITLSPWSKGRGSDFVLVISKTQY